MYSSAYDLLVVPILWGTLGSIGAGAALVFAKRMVENLVKKWLCAHGLAKPRTRNIHAPLSRSYLPAFSRLRYQDSRVMPAIRHTVCTMV